MAPEAVPAVTDMPPAETLLSGDNDAGIGRIVRISLNIMQGIGAVARLTVPDIPVHIVAQEAIEMDGMVQLVGRRDHRDSRQVFDVAAIASAGHT